MPKRLLNSFAYALAGIRAMIRSEANARIHLFFMVLVVAAGLFFSVSNIEWCVLIFAIAMVFSAEAFNTAIETLTDLVSPEKQPLAGTTKDLAAGAVLITAIGAALAGLIIFLPKIIHYITFVVE